MATSNRRRISTSLTDVTGYATPYVASDKYLELNVIQRPHIIIYSKKGAQCILFQFSRLNKRYIKSIYDDP
jgi:hypothetical protein